MRRWLVVALVLALVLGRSPAALAGDLGPCPVDPNGCYVRGLEAIVDGDPVSAETYFDKALAGTLNDIKVSDIAYFYQTGEHGLPQDFARAAALYERAGRSGFGSPLLNLAVMTWHGQGVPQDRAAAAHLFRQGLINLEFLSGDVDRPRLDGLIRGGPLPADLLAELTWVHDLVTTPGMAEAVADELLTQIPPDAVAACRYLALSASRHPNADTAYWLGMVHFGGQGIEPARFYAYLYLRRAARDDHPAATAEIGRRLIQGDVPMRHAWDGLAWLLRAQALGHDVADEIAAAEENLSPPAIAEATRSVSSRPFFDAPRSGEGNRCVRSLD